MAHTPGPWVIQDGDGHHEINSTGNRWSAIANVEKTNDLGARELFKEESEANARLIAAAPDLLEACKLRIEDHQCSQKSDGPHRECPCWYCRTCAAISKAEGRKQS